jgi:hypothetical protein
VLVITPGKYLDDSLLLLPQSFHATNSILYDLVNGFGLVPQYNIHAGRYVPANWGDWPKWGDQEDGTYRNPVIPSDYQSTSPCLLLRNVPFAIEGDVFLLVSIS